MRRALLLIIVVLTLAPLAAPAEGEIIATILVRGLEHVDRELLLRELGIREGDPCPPNLQERLENRARRLPYLLSFRAETSLYADGVHVIIQLRERRQLSLFPRIGLLDDGDLVGGFRLEGYSLLGRGETWDLDLMTGAATDLGLTLRGVSLPARWLPKLFLQARFSDWEDPFLASALRRGSLLAGLELPLPAGGELLLGGGREFAESDPPVGHDPLGEDSHALFRGRLRQPLPAGLSLRGEATLRAPEDRRGYGWGQGGLESRHQAGRWTFRALAQAGAVSSNSPMLGSVHLSSWKWLHAYEAGTLRAGNWQHFRLRADLLLIHVPLRMSRRGPTDLSPLTAFVLAEHARYRPGWSDPFGEAGDLGLGLSLRPPQSRQTLSVGAFLDREGEMTWQFLLEAGW